MGYIKGPSRQCANLVATLCLTNSHALGLVIVVANEFKVVRDEVGQAAHLSCEEGELGNQGRLCPTDEVDI